MVTRYPCTLHHLKGFSPRQIVLFCIEGRNKSSLVHNERIINSPAGDTPVVLLGIFLYVVRNLDNFVLSDPESFLLAFNECMACPCSGSFENPSAFECALVDLNSRSY